MTVTPEVQQHAMAAAAKPPAVARVIWVSGASSGIGDAFVGAVPDRDARVIGISRRPRQGIEHLAADLSDPTTWPVVESHFRETLGAGQYSEALFFHCAGTVAANGPLIEADSAEYTRSVLLNSASGQVLGRAFLAATSEAGCRATLIMCSSPGATTPLAGMSHYCGGKAASEHWTRAVAVEFGDAPDAARIFSVVPHETDTALLREIVDGAAAATPLATFFRSAIANDALATPERVGKEIWQAVDRGVPQGAAVPVGLTESMS
jgi:short-subunit dehydrogenase